MNPRERARLQRQWALQQRSAQLRDRLSAHAHTLAPVLGVAERVRQGARWVRQHPVLPVLVASLLLWKRPRQVLRWGGRAWAWWGTLKKIKSAWGRAQQVRHSA